MDDKEQIIAELEKNIKDVEEQSLLHSMLDELFEKYSEGSAKAVTEVLQAKIKPLKSKFDDAYARLLKENRLIE